MTDDRRLARRLRTRLRSARLYTNDGCFLADGQLIERSILGARVRIDSTFALPQKLQFFDDEQKLLYPVDLRWRRGTVVGLSFTAKPSSGEIINPEPDDAILVDHSIRDLVLGPR